MRFGIMTMQAGILVPEGLVPEAIHDYAVTFDHAALVDALVREGFHTIELSGDLTLFFPRVFSPPQISALRVLREERNITYTVHLPLWSVEPSTPLRPVREGSVQALVECVQATLPLEPEVYVLHATGALASEFYRMVLPEPGHSLVLRQFQQAAMLSLQRILVGTGVPSRKLAVETIEFPLELTLEMAEALDLSICLDVGHVLSGFSGPFSVLEVLDLCVSRLAEVHLHDALRPPAPDKILYGRDHRSLGMGDLDLGSFLDQLEAMAFDGPVILELPVADAKRSLAEVRSVRPHLV